MGPRDKTPPLGRNKDAERTPVEREGRDEEKVEREADYDEAVADSFPASDPPSSSGIVGPTREPGQRSEGA